jgi:exopolysaccharide biosynthesis polyprenyl glycosylphosphotransferase
VATFDTLKEYLSTEVVDEVINVLPFSRSLTQSKRIDKMCEEQGIKERFLSPISDVSLAKATVETFQGEPVITLYGSSRDSWAQNVKRQIDLLASVVLLIVSSPLMLLLAVAVKATSPGPVLFVQERMGLNKRIFRLYKFRTMVKDAEKMIDELEELNEVEGPVFKIAKDPRVTPIGRFLRKSSLDELPQLFNVFRGHMSLVGPRPLPLRDVRGFDQDRHRRRFTVRPGLTCYWQVNGRNNIPFDEWMDLDLKYIDDWTLWLDLKLILKTIPVVFRPIFFGHPGEFSERSKKLAEVLEFKNRAADEQSSNTRVAAPELQTPPS